MLFAFRYFEPSSISQWVRIGICKRFIAKSRVMLCVICWEYAFGSTGSWPKCIERRGPLGPIRHVVLAIRRNKVSLSIESECVVVDVNVQYLKVAPMANPKVMVSINWNPIVVFNQLPRLVTIRKSFHFHVDL